MSVLQQTFRRSTRYLPMSVILLILAVLAVLPIGMLIYASIIDVVPRPGSTGGALTREWYSNIANRAYLVAGRNSMVIAIGGTSLALLFGTGLAWIGARTDVPGKSIVALAGIVPLFVSSLVGALAWSFLGSPNQGFLNILLRPIGLDVINVYSIPGIIFVFGLYYAPYSFLLVYSALSLMNPELEESAHTHGATNFTVMRIVTLPLVAPAIIGGGLLTFALILENFSVPTVLGTPAGVNTLPTFIYRLMNAAPPDANQAAAVGALLMALLVVIVFVQRKVLSRREYTTVAGKGFRPRVVTLGRWRWAGFAFAATYIFLAVVLPLMALLQMAFRNNLYIAGAAELFDPSAFGLDTMIDVLTYSSFQTGITNSVVVAVSAALLGVVFCFAMAFTVARSKLPGRQVIEYLAMVPVAVPAIVMGMGILWAWFLLPLPIYGTLAILVFAYIGRFMPQGFTSIAASIRQVHTDLEESAVVSGASKTRSSLEVTVPLIRSSVIAAMLLLLILSFRELSVALFLFTTDTRVLSIVIFDFWNGGSLGRAAAASLLYSALLTVIVLAARRWMGVKQAG
ncbi:MAG: ABC transporter permease subunit [Pseudonocardiaceae bacterium]|nr:ABC transporter permease subunit [Pseudonocardiaceae bacterium]